MKGRAAMLGLALGSWLSPAVAQDAGSGAPRSGSETCEQRLPEGKAAPKLKETFPARGLSGHAAVLEVEVEHGKGETVLPHGLKLQSGSSEFSALERTGFVVPHPDGGAGPSITRSERADSASTLVRLPVVPLPEKPGRHILTLPPLPITLSRASGELLTVCTAPHRIVVDDPIANEVDPKPHDNPGGLPQPEEWTTLKHIVYASLLALALGALLFWLLSKWLRREKPAPPPPPPRPPWERALEALADLRASSLMEREKYTELFERTVDVVREYCGERYDFDGLESTTREALSVMRRIVPPIGPLDDVEGFLRRADLVKFARLTPTPEECVEALERAETIVESTIPSAIDIAPRLRPETAPARGQLGGER